MDDPTRYLVEPKPIDATVSNGYANPLDIFDLVSLTAWVNQAIIEVTGHDVLMEIVQPFTGDWQAFSRFGDALRNLAPCMQAVGMDIQQQMLTVDATWSGRANDAAYNYFTDLAARTSGMQHVLREAAANYEETATGVWQLARQAANLVQSLIDEVVIIAIASAVGTALIETGVGAVAGYAVAAWRIVEAWKLLNHLIAVIQTLGSVVLAFVSLLEQVNWRFGELDKIALPESAYDHPALG